MKDNEESEELEDSLYYGKIKSNDNKNNKIISQFINTITKTNEIQKYVVNKLLDLYNFNAILIQLIKRKYEQLNSKYFTEYYIISSNWMKNYLQFYNYEKISLIIKRKSNGEPKVEDICEEIKRKSIYEQPGEENKKKII